MAQIKVQGDLFLKQNELQFIMNLASEMPTMYGKDIIDAFLQISKLREEETKKHEESGS